MLTDINKDNYLLYAIKAYDKPNLIKSEFKDDIKRFNYLKRLFFRYRKYNELKERLILNHIMVIYNVFGVEVSTKLLFFKIPEEDHSALKTFLLFLSYMPDTVGSVKGKHIISSNIPVDMQIVDALRQIK